MAETQDEPDLVALAFELIALNGWNGFRLGELAQRAGLPLARVHAELPSRAALLRRLGERLDRAMLEVDPGELAELEPRDRVFELIMRRLDAMASFKPGLRALSREGCSDPDVVLASMCNLSRLAEWLLDTAGARAGGLGGIVGRKVLALIYLRVFGVWLRDETPDQAHTLAELDRRLRQAEQLARWLHPRRARPGTERGSGSGDESPPEAPPVTA
ncbi:MAG TPA: hypothetical protein VFG43_09140 [Geminicoccaceae bacterium]|nr:hypothetical protein [Geminicoccaceae bacterium]